MKTCQTNSCRRRTPRLAGAAGDGPGGHDPIDGGSDGDAAGAPPVDFPWGGATGWCDSAWFRQWEQLAYADLGRA